MEFTKKNAIAYYPEGEDKEQKITHLCISAHQDDIELMAYHGIVECFGQKDRWFSGVVVTDGSGSPRSGIYADYSDEEMKEVRVKEQIKASIVGEYGSQYMLAFSSSEVKYGGDAVVNDIYKILKATKPKFVYTHNLADKHDTHVAVALRTIQALQMLEDDEKPIMLYGCEVWRSLDWVNDKEKLVLDVSGHPNLSRALVSVFDSQICGGKRYDLACDGRRLANATYYESHSTDESDMTAYAVNMTALMEKGADPNELINKYIESFKKDVNDRITKFI